MVREASWRVLGLRHYDVQMVGGMTLNDGRCATQNPLLRLSPPPSAGARMVRTWIAAAARARAAPWCGGAISLRTPGSRCGQRPLRQLEIG